MPKSSLIRVSVLKGEKRRVLQLIELTHYGHIHQNFTGESGEGDLGHHCNLSHQDSIPVFPALVTAGCFLSSSKEEQDKKFEELLGFRLKHSPASSAHN